MNSAKVLADLVSSATGAKTHYDIWWAQMSDAKPQYIGVMNQHNDFFRASQNVHYTACFIYLAHLFDKRPDSSSLPTYLTLIRGSSDPVKFQEFESRFSMLASRTAPLITVRHKAVAHVDAHLSEKDICDPLNITWNQIQGIIYETAAFVEELADSRHQGAVGIPRNGRLREATLNLLHTLTCSASIKK